MTLFSVQSADGVRLQLRAVGPEAAPPIVLLHGWSQTQQCWRAQFDGPLAERFRLIGADLRGHGMSDQPEATEAYAEGARWAEDLAAILAALGDRKPVVVAWSYAGLMVGDYLRRYGGAGLAGVLLVGALSQIGGAEAQAMMGPDVGPAAARMASADHAKILDGAVAFTDLCFAAPPDRETFARFVSFNVTVSSAARRGAFKRVDDFRPDYASAAAATPIKALHGGVDRVVSAVMAASLAAASPDIEVEIWPEAGHAPFAEAPERFDAAVTAFATKAFAL